MRSLIIALVLACAGVSPAHADSTWTSSSAGPCTVFECAFPSHQTRTWQLSPGKLTIAPYCIAPEVDSPACLTAVQGSSGGVPGMLSDSIEVNSTVQGARLSIVVCNNYTEGEIIHRCKGTTRITVVITLPELSGASVTVSDVCLSSIPGAYFSRCVQSWTAE